MLSSFFNRQFFCSLNSTLFNPLPSLCHLNQTTGARLFFAWSWLLRHELLTVEVVCRRESFIHGNYDNNSPIQLGTVFLPDVHRQAISNLSKWVTMAKIYLYTLNTTDTARGKENLPKKKKVERIKWYLKIVSLVNMQTLYGYPHYGRLSKDTGIANGIK